MGKALIVRDPVDVAAQAGPVTWALSQLQDALTTRGVACEETPADEGVCVVVATSASALAQEMLEAARVSLPDVAEALAVVPGKHAGRPAVLVCGTDCRGLVYAILELADRVAHADEPLGALLASRPVVEQPANRVRGIARLFVSEVEDKPWFCDRSFWRRYLTMLASQRFNRFHLALGIGYDFVRNVIDADPLPVFVPGVMRESVGLGPLAGPQGGA